MHLKKCIECLRKQISTFKLNFISKSNRKNNNPKSIKNFMDTSMMFFYGLKAALLRNNFNNVGRYTNTIIYIYTIYIIVHTCRLFFRLKRTYLFSQHENKKGAHIYAPSWNLVRPTWKSVSSFGFFFDNSFIPLGTIHKLRW